MLAARLGTAALLIAGLLAALFFLPVPALIALVAAIAGLAGHEWARLCALAGPAAPITEERLAPLLSMAYAPEPDLFVRTGGEQRVSNFLLWQLA